jgi:ribonuclease P/MRP protein subunit RPP40
VVFFDISKAFDKVWHPGLLNKLKQCGIDGALLQWYTSYLLDRKQRVVISGETSDIKRLHAGVPQGSILGPLLFLVYVSDMTENVACGKVRFADDVTFFKLVTQNRAETIDSLNIDLNTTLTWADINRTIFNSAKTYFMRISNKKRKPILNPIYLDGKAVKEVESHSNLGLIYQNT